MTSHLFRVTFEHLDYDDLYDIEFSETTDDCYYA